MRTTSVERFPARHTPPVGEPWTQRRDWAQGCAEGEGGGSLARAWLAVVLWNGVTFPCAWWVIRGDAGRDPARFLVLILPGAGVLLLAWVLRASLRRARFGRTFLRLDAVPVPLGRTLRGTIEAPLPGGPVDGVHLTLACVNRITSGSGRSRSSFEHIRWQDDHLVGTGQLARGPRGATLIPVSFDVPRDLRPTDRSDSRNTIRWLLRAQASLRGLDFDELYEVPVFETPESTLVAAPSAATPAAPTWPIAAPRRRTIPVSTTPSGGTAYDFGAGRNPGMALGTTLFALAFAAIEWFLIEQRAPSIFRIAFGAAVVILAWGALRLWFLRSRVVVEVDRLGVEWSTLRIRRRRSWPREALRSVRCRIGAQSGQGARGVPYYDVVVGDASGKDHVVGSGLRDHHEAEWIVADPESLAPPGRPGHVASTSPRARARSSAGGP